MVGICEGTRARVPRVVLRLNRPDLNGRKSAREGVIDLTVVGRGLGPSVTVSAAFQGHYARFVELQ